MEYSERLGMIRPEQVQAALGRFGLGRFVGVERVRFGNFGQNVFVLSTQGEWVLRGAPLLPGQFEEERYFCRTLHERTGVPVPWPYHLDISREIFPWPYALMPRLRGLELEDPEVWDVLGTESRRGAAEALGTTLAEMQAATWPAAGGYDAASDTIAPFEHGFGEWTILRIRRNLASARRHAPHVTTADDAAWAEEVIERGRDALGVAFEPRLVMQDYKYQNALVERAGAGGRVSGLFDLAGACYGDGEAALPRQVAMFLEREPPLARTFAVAYLAARPARPGFVGRMGVYALDERLAIWEWAQRERNLWWDPDLTLRAWAEPFTAWYADLR